MTHPDNMGHLAHLQAVADSDVAVVRKKESTYQGSWKAAGGRSAWFMFRRNMDRLLKMMRPPVCNIHFSIPDLDDAIEQAGKGDGDCTLDFSVVKYLRDAYVAEDIFAQIEQEPSGKDGTVFAVLRDMRRYALLIEAEMVAQGMARPEETESHWGRSAQELTDDLQPRLDAFSPELMQATLNASRGEDIVRQALERVLGLDGMDIYMFVARLIDVPRDAARRKVLQVLFGVDSEEGLGADLTYLKARLPSAIDIAERPGTPADGGHHEDLRPWAVSHPWLHSHLTLMQKHLQGGVVWERWWKQQGRDLFVLEAAVPEDAGSLPAVIAHLYDTVGKFRVVRVTSCPPGAREWFPGLRREVNSVELDGLPEWQRGMYRWHNSAAKWIIEDQHEAWVQD